MVRVNITNKVSPESGATVESCSNRVTSGAARFTQLNDTPNSYSGQASKLVAVNIDETALEFIAAGSGTGNVVGPASSIDNSVVRFDTTTGKLIQDSAVTIDDSGNITTAGTVDGRDISVDGTKLDTIATGAEVNTVDSVNTQTGVVVLDADDIDDTATTNKFVTATDITKLSNTSGTNTGDQTITLTGDITGSGTSSFATTISAGSVDIPMLSTTGTADATTFLRGDNTWSTPAGSSGDVVGPASATDNAITRFDGTTGELIQNSTVTIDDTGNSSGTLSQTFADGTAVTTAAGKMWYNDTTGSWNLGMGGGNVNQQVGEEMYRYGKASSAITESPLQLVYKTGVIGASGEITFAPAIAGIIDYDQILGCATEDIALNGFGRITTYGVIHNIATDGTAYSETWADNDDIYYNPVTGGLTKTEPVAPNIKLFIGTVINAASGGAGSFIVKLGVGLCSNDIADIQTSSLTGGQLLTYNATDGYWSNVNLTDGTAISITETTGGAVTIDNTGVTSLTGTTDEIDVSTSTGAVTLSLPATINADTTGNAATVTTNANLTGHITSTGNAAILGSFTSAQLATALSDETGTGAAVFAGSPTFTGTVVAAAISATGTLDLNNNNIQEVKTATFNGEIDDGNSSTADTIDFGTGNNHKSTMTGACTYTFTAPAGPASLVLRLIQDATGSRVATWPATVKWSGGTAPTLTTTANAIDIVTFYFDGTNYNGAWIGNFS